jgi:hypothetical protein
MSLRNFAEAMLPLYAPGGIVFGVGFGGVSNGIGLIALSAPGPRLSLIIVTEGKSPLDEARWPRYGLSGSTLDAMRRSRYDRRKSPLDAVRWPHYGLSGSTLDAMRRSRYDRRKSPLDAARWPHYGLSGSTLDAMRRSRYDRRKSPLDAHVGPVMA